MKSERMIKMMQQDIDLVDIYTRADSIVECTKHLQKKFSELTKHVRTLPKYEVLKEKNWQAINNISAAVQIIECVAEMTQNNLNYIQIQAELIQGTIADDTEHLLKLENDTD